MLTLKEQLIQDIRYMEEDTLLKSIERLDSGEYNEMTFMCEPIELIQIINNGFDDDLKGYVPNGYPTQIIGWEFIPQ